MEFFSAVKENPWILFWIYLGIINLVTFVVMGIDKLKAKKGARRIAESTLFLLAIVGGSIGGIAGMYAFKHKTLHKQFTIGFPLILIMQIALIVFVAVKINE